MGAAGAGAGVTVGAGPGAGVRPPTSLGASLKGGKAPAWTVKAAGTGEAEAERDQRGSAGAEAEAPAGVAAGAGRGVRTGPVGRAAKSAGSEMKVTRGGGK